MILGSPFLHIITKLTQLHSLICKSKEMDVFPKTRKNVFNSWNLEEEKYEYKM
jgi:hypothetical protein